MTGEKRAVYIYLVDRVLLVLFYMEKYRINL